MNLKAPEGELQLSSNLEESPRIAYLRKAVPRALAQSVSARTNTCLTVPANQRLRRMKEQQNYCLTQGVLNQNASQIETYIASHEEDENFNSGDLTPEIIGDYNRHYWNQLIQKKNVPLPILRVDDPLQVFYPSNQGRLSAELGSASTKDYLISQASNWEEVAKKLKDHSSASDMESSLREGSLAYMTNHSSWPNIPFLVAAMHKAYGIPLEKFHVLIGPALTTFEQGLGLAQIANVIKTIPPTSNGKLPEKLQYLEKKITNRSNRKVKNILKENGNILLYCPFGTTDKKDPSTGELVLDALDERVLKLQRTINSMAPVTPVGTYDLEAFNGAKTLSPGRVNINFGKKHEKKEIRDKKDQLNICEDLAQNIINYNGKKAGRLRTFVAGANDFQEKTQAV